MEQEEKTEKCFAREDITELYDRAFYYYQIGAYFAAKETLEKALDLRPENVRIFLKIVILLSKSYRGINSQFPTRKGLDEAIKYIKELYKTFPQHYEINCELGDLYFDLAKTLFHILKRMLKDDYFLFLVQHEGENKVKSEKLLIGFENKINEIEILLHTARKHYTEALRIRPIKSDAKFRIELIDNMFMQSQEFRPMMRNVLKGNLLSKSKTRFENGARF